MKSDKQPEHSQWVIATFGEPIIWHRTFDEAYLLNPLRRYVMNADNLHALNPFVTSISDLKGSTFFNPVMSGKAINDATILVERNRDRGIGDLLFMTGPLEFFRHVSGGSAQVHMYALSDRGMVLQNHKALRHKTTLSGPLHYDDLGLYNYHWLVDAVTECNEEPDQLNVYDALYRQIGFDPEVIDPKFKRPTVYLEDSDYDHLNQYYRVVWERTKIDLRRNPYYVVAPFAAATLRSAPYGTWLKIIEAVSKRRPVVVVGLDNRRVPDTDMTPGEFAEELVQFPNVVHAIGATGIRVLMAMISRAACLFCVDSGPLYVAQALRVPAISLWGTHDPGVRIGYDTDYMELAVWDQQMCNYSPCYAYSNFPAHKCPRRDKQTICEVLFSVDVDEVMKRVDIVESKNVVLGKFGPK